MTELVAFIGAVSEESQLYEWVFASGVINCHIDDIETKMLDDYLREDYVWARKRILEHTDFLYFRVERPLNPSWIPDEGRKWYMFDTIKAKVGFYVEDFSKHGVVENDFFLDNGWSRFDNIYLPIILVLSVIFLAVAGYKGFKFYEERKKN